MGRSANKKKRQTRQPPMKRPTQHAVAHTSFTDHDIRLQFNIINGSVWEATFSGRMLVHDVVKELAQQMGVMWHDIVLLQDEKIITSAAYVGSTLADMHVESYQLWTVVRKAQCMMPIRFLNCGKENYTNHV